MWSVLRDSLWEPLPGPVKATARAVQIALGPVLFLCGFTWDALMLSRIDALLDNLMLASYLLFLGLFITLDQRAEDGRLPDLLVRGQWIYRLAVHFFFGGLLSAYVVYYLRSATFGRTALFLGLLAGLLLANEFLQRWFHGPGIRLALYLFCTFSFLLFWIPVTTGLLGKGVWALAAIGAFVATAVVKAAIEISPGSLPGTMRRLAADVRRVAGRGGEGGEEEPGPEHDGASGGDASEVEVEVEISPALDRIRRDPVARVRWLLTPAASWTASGASWAGLLGVLLLLELAGAIPPVPISVLHTGMYHDVSFEGGQVVLTYEAPPWWRFWATDDSRWRLRKGDRVCFFAPVFSPGGLHPRLYHRWERWDPESGTWEWTKDKGTWIRAKGGREHGSPHYTCKRYSHRVGPWRVSVETEDGRVVGTHRFDMVGGEHPEVVLRERRWP